MRQKNIVLVLLLIALLLPALPAEAQGTGHFGDITATGSYPQRVVFSVVVESDVDIVEMELCYRVSGTPYTMSRWPDFRAARRVETSYELDTQVEFYSPGSEFHYYWVVTDAAGRVLESPTQTFVYQDDRFNWQQVSTERIAVYWYEGQASFGQEVLDTASRTLDRMEREAGVRAHQLIRIYLYANQRDFRGALGPNAASWIGGQAIPALGIIVAHIQPSDTREIGRMIPHEVSHVVLYQATHNPYASNPNWLEEGIAVHNQEVADLYYDLVLEEAAREGQLIPLRALAASFPSDPDLAILSYAQSSSIVEFILERYGEEGLSSLVSVFAEGETAEAAVQRALGIPLEELEAQWRETLPAAERTPIPGTTWQPTSTKSDRDLDRVLRIVGSALACTFLAAVGVIVAAVVLIVRRQRQPPEEEY